MNLTVLQYNHKHDPSFCAPNSLYLQINSMIDSFISEITFYENISLDDIARNIGFQKSMGSNINTTSLSKLSNRVNKIIQTHQLRIPKLALLTLNKSTFFQEINNVTSNRIYTICVSFSQYQRFILKQQYFAEYYEGAEKLSDGYIQHCLTLIIQKTNNVPKYIIIDPNIELDNKNIAIDISQLEKQYSNKIISINKDDIESLLTMRDDSMDDDNIIIMIDFEGNSNLDMY